MKFEEEEFDKKKGITEIFQYDDDGLIIGSMFIHRKKKMKEK